MYRKLAVMGRGAQGVTFVGEHDGKRVILKYTYKDRFNPLETNILRRINSDFVIRLIDVYDEPPYVV